MTDWLKKKQKNSVFPSDFFSLLKGFEYCLSRISQAVSCFIKLYVFGLSEPTFYDKLSKMMEENLGEDMRGLDSINIPELFTLNHSGKY